MIVGRAIFAFQHLSSIVLIQTKVEERLFVQDLGMTQMLQATILSKALSPTDDGGVFDLLIDGVVVLADASNGQSSMAQLVDVGAVARPAPRRHRRRGHR